MMPAGLGDAVEGSYQDLILKKPTNADTPFLCVLDEYGYYAVKGFAVVPAQARSLGFSVIFAGQDLPAFQKASKEEAASIGANTNIKICMKLEDPTDTGTSSAYVTTVDSFNAGGGNMAGGYMDSKSAKAEKRSRIDLLDLKDQGVGEAHFFFQSNIVRARIFYANPQPCNEMRLNQMTKVDLPKDQDLYKLVKGIEDFEVFAQQPQLMVEVEKDSLIEDVVRRFERHLEQEDGVPIVAATSAIFEMAEAADAKSESSVPGFEGILSIFSEVEESQTLQLPDGSNTMTSLLSKDSTAKNVKYMERLLGKGEDESEQAKEHLLMDMYLSTMYQQPEEYDLVSANEVGVEIEKLAQTIQSDKEAAEE